MILITFPLVHYQRLLGFAVVLNRAVETLGRYSPVGISKRVGTDTAYVVHLGSRFFGLRVV